MISFHLIIITCATFSVSITDEVKKMDIRSAQIRDSFTWMAQALNMIGKRWFAWLRAIVIFTLVMLFIVVLLGFVFSLVVVRGNFDHSREAINHFVGFPNVVFSPMILIVLLGFSITIMTITAGVMFCARSQHILGGFRWFRIFSSWKTFGRILIVQCLFFPLVAGIIALGLMLKSPLSEPSFYTQWGGYFLLPIIVGVLFTLISLLAGLCAFTDYSVFKVYKAAGVAIVKNIFVFTSLFVANILAHMLLDFVVQLLTKSLGVDAAFLMNVSLGKATLPASIIILNLVGSGCSILIMAWSGITSYLAYQYIFQNAEPQIKSNNIVSKK